MRAIECMTFTSARARDAAPDEQVAPFSAFLFIQFMRLRGVQSSATHVTRSRLLTHWLGGGVHLGVHSAAAAIMNKVELTIACGMKQSSRTHHVTHDVPPACSVARVAAKKRRCGA